MADLERELRQTLKRREPPRDLTPAILARIGTGSKRPGASAGFFWRQTLVAAAIVLALVAGLDRLREYQKGRQAKQQLMLALQITTQKLALIQEKVDKLNQRSIGHVQ